MLVNNQFTLKIFLIRCMYNPIDLSNCSQCTWDSGNLLDWKKSVRPNTSGGDRPEYENPPMKSRRLGTVPATAFSRCGEHREKSTFPSEAHLTHYDIAVPATSYHEDILFCIATYYSLPDPCQQFNMGNSRLLEIIPPVIPPIL